MKAQVFHSSEADFGFPLGVGWWVATCDDNGVFHAPALPIGPFRSEDEAIANLARGTLRARNGTRMVPL